METYCARKVSYILIYYRMCCSRVKLKNTYLLPRKAVCLQQFRHFFQNYILYRSNLIVLYDCFYMETYCARKVPYVLYIIKLGLCVQTKKHIFIATKSSMTTTI